MPTSRNERSNTLRSPLLNRLTMVTLLTIVVAIGYLISYYVRGAMLNHTTWYHASRTCSPTEQTCRVMLGQAGSLAVRIEKSQDHQLTLQVDTDATQVMYINALLERRESDPEPRRITLQKGENGHYRADVMLPCAYPDPHWRISIVMQEATRAVGTWYDIDEPCPAH